MVLTGRRDGGETSERRPAKPSGGSLKTKQWETRKVRFCASGEERRFGEVSDLLVSELG